MPIYAYRCSSCGHAKDVLQKLSDAALTVCPACGESTLAKQLTAAGFQLKGSGWYATDFKGGNSTKKADGDKAAGDKTETSAGDAAKPDPGKTETSKAETSKTEGAQPAVSGTPAKSGDATSSPSPSSAPKAAGGERSSAGC